METAWKDYFKYITVILWKITSSAVTQPIHDKQ